MSSSADGLNSSLVLFEKDREGYSALAEAMSIAVAVLDLCVPIFGRLPMPLPVLDLHLKI